MSILKRLRSRFVRSTTARHLRDDSGATAVEFAMVAPVFFLMVGVIMETGLMLFTEYALQTSVQEAARIVRTGQAQSAAMTLTQFKTELCEIAGTLIDCNGKVSVYMTSAASSFQTLNTSMPSYLNVGAKDDGSANPTSFSCGAPGTPVALIATYDWEFAIPYFMSFFGNIAGDKKRRMAGVAIFKNEPYPSSVSSCSAS
jgi:Flp pilus assembly protein TadG